MKSFEDLCEDIRAFARANPHERHVLVSDSAVYGAGMDAGIAMAKLKALSHYAKKEWGLTLFIENRADDAVRARPRDAAERQRDAAAINEFRRQRDL